MKSPGADAARLTENDSSTAARGIERTPMDWIFAGITGIVALLAIGNWRAALYGCLLLDVARDPVRKLTEQQSSLMTVIVGFVWLAAMLGALSTESRESRMLFRRYPRLQTSLILLVVALLPGALISTTRFNNGWMLAAIGAASYTAPFVGVVLGYLWPRRVGDVYRWMAAYVIINSAFLIGVVLESAAIDIPGLGGLKSNEIGGDGLKMEWVRNYGTDLIKLICGFYRSPDVMGLHAAHVIMFGVLLALRPGKRSAWFWLSLCTWAMTCLLLCGRRKMIAIPLVFLVAYLALVALSSGRKRIAISMATFAVTVILGLQFVIETQEISDDYARYAASIASEGFERTTRTVTEIISTTIDQSGWLGDGLGTVTQGRQYLGVITKTRDWQEDGVGRLFKELGVPGVVLAVASIVFMLGALRSSFDAIPTGHPVLSLQFGIFGIVAANFASFVVSHQAYSGDPSTVLIVGFCLGIGLGLPRPVWANAVRESPRPIAEAEPAGPE